MDDSLSDDLNSEDDGLKVGAGSNVQSEEDEVVDEQKANTTNADEQSRSTNHTPTPVASVEVIFYSNLILFPTVSWLYVEI